MCKEKAGVCGANKNVHPYYKMAAPGLNQVFIREIEGQKQLIFKGSNEYIIIIDTLTDEDETPPEFTHRRGGHLFKLNGKDLAIWRESISEDDEIVVNGTEVWDSKGEINYYDSDDVFISAFFTIDDLRGYNGDNENEAYDRLVAHIKSHCKLSGGRRRKTRRIRRRRN